MKIARIIAMLLLVATCLTMVVACRDDSGEGSGEGTKVTTTAGGSGDSNLDANGFIKDKVADTNYGETINILCWNQSTKEYDIEELADDADDVDVALYNRNRKVEDRLGVELVYHPIDGGSTTTIESFTGELHKSTSSNLGTYDAVGAYTRCAGVSSTKGDYVNLKDVANIDTDMPWWPEEIISTNTVADRLYAATGDIATSLIYQMEFLVINQEFAEDLNLDVEEIQQNALAGNGAAGGWTFDQMLNISANAWDDADAIAGKSVGDKFGIIFTGHPLFDMFYMGAGLNYVASTEEGLSISKDYWGPNSLALLTKFANAFKQNAYFYGSADVTAGLSLMYTVTGATLAGSLRNATYTYHILPAPKLTNDQVDYFTAVQFPHSMYSIPIDAKDRDMSGAVLEVMASESYRQVTPVLFDKVFLYKLTNAVIDMNMLNLIRDRTTFDLGRTFFEVLGGDTNGPVRLWRNLVVSGSTKIQGHVNQNLTRWNKILKEDIYAALSK